MRVPGPAELVDLDLHETWEGAEPLRDEFDPFRFDHRMAAYRQLIDATNVDGRFGADNRMNPLWGLMFQHQWQLRSGRLGAGAAASRRIDPDAAWGYGNYALAVVPWLGAAAAGVVPELPVADAGPSRFRYVTVADGLPAEFARGVADWRAYFQLTTADLDTLQLALWKAHKSCLDAVAVRLATVDPAPYSRFELTFLRGWCRMVDYLWAAAWPTDFDFMRTHGLDVLPERLLDSEADLAELPGRTRRNVRNVVRLAGLPAWRYAVNLALWRRAMRTREARGEVVPMLDAVFNPRPDNAAQRRRLLGYLLRP
jgi:uncharacterized protein DUF781